MVLHQPFEPAQQIGKVPPSTHLDGFRVNQALDCRQRAEFGDHRIGMDCHGFSQVPTHGHTSSLMHVEPVFSLAAWPDSGVDWRRFSAQ